MGVAQGDESEKGDRWRPSQEAWIAGTGSESKIYVKLWNEKEKEMFIKELGLVTQTWSSGFP